MTSQSRDLHAVASAVRSSLGLAAKADIAVVVAQLGLSGSDAVAVGDDCAAIADGDGFLLFAIEGFINPFVAADPWFAGWCGVMVNVSDVAAMGGRPLAVTDAIWAEGTAGAEPMLAGLHAAAAAFGVPIIGGHSNLRCDRGQLAVAILGRAQRLLTSFDARPGDRLLAAIDLRGVYRPGFDHWDAATDAPWQRLRGDIDILARIAEAGLCLAAKDISQAGTVGTAAMLAECSGVGLAINIGAVPKPDDVDIGRWLRTFPSFGYLLAVRETHVAAVSDMFTARDIAVRDIGGITAERRVVLTDGVGCEEIWDFTLRALMGCGRPGNGVSGHA